MPLGIYVWGSQDSLNVLQLTIYVIAYDLILSYCVTFMLTIRTYVYMIIETPIPVVMPLYILLQSFWPGMASHHTL